MRIVLRILLVALLLITLAATNIVFAAGRFSDQETASSVFGAISGWLDFAWHWRVPITINSNDSLNDYQLQITIDTASLVATGKMQDSGNDIRFTGADGMTQINYWIDSGMNTSSTVIWVKVPSIPAGNSMIYMYYGNTSALAASDGDGTFIFFDDFENGFTPDGKWTIVNQDAGSISLSTNNVFQGASSIRITDSPNGSNLGLYAYFSPQTECMIEYAIYFTQQGSKEIQMLDVAQTIGPRGEFVRSKGNTNTLEYYVTGWTSLGKFQAGRWYQCRTVIPDITTATDYYSLYFYSDTGNLLVQADNLRFNNNADLDSLAFFKYIGTSDSRTDTCLDVVKVRAYTATEPIYSLGGEQ